MSDKIITVCPFVETVCNSGVLDRRGRISNLYNLAEELFPEDNIILKCAFWVNGVCKLKNP